MMAFADEDNSGEIDFEEFLKIQNLQDQMKQDFDHLEELKQ